MAANTIEDILVNYLKNSSQWTKTLIAKLIGEKKLTTDVSLVKVLKKTNR